jgi:hypothetical protein
VPGRYFNYRPPGWYFNYRPHRVVARATALRSPTPARVLPHRGLRDLSRHHGELVLLRLGDLPVIVASSADAAREDAAGAESRARDAPRQPDDPVGHPGRRRGRHLLPLRRGLEADAQCLNRRAAQRPARLVLQAPPRRGVGAAWASGEPEPPLVGVHHRRVGACHHREPVQG